MNFLRRLGGSSEEEYFDGNITARAVIEKSVELFARFSIEIRDHGVGPLHRDLVLVELLREYRGSSELSPLYWICLILTNGLWVKKKDGSGYGFRGAYKVKINSENLSVDRHYTYDRTFFMTVKSWTLSVTMEFSTKPAPTGFDPTNRIRKFMEEHNLHHSGINFREKIVIS
ncbi:matrix [Nasoule virus]|uniref:Matrix n=1 Tax=Nasoule virus TaxID=864695 RepID=A0AAE8XDD2_9RHAB|nr:matrix [Nasoule virus]UAU42862.1 matrix [Nasoule virus]